MSDFDPFDYDSVREACDAAESGEEFEQALDYFDPVTEGGAQLDDADNGYDRGHQDAVSSGAKIRAKVKRGTGTRDQDEIVIEGRGATAAEAADDFERALSRAEDKDYADRLRALGNSGDDE